MNGAEALVQTAVGAGIEVCFANPGTTELPVVAALDARPGIRAVLGLHETVATGAADGYGRMAGKPALTLLHLGPGLANGLANLHNARRARTPLVNLIGEHATWHRDADAPLASDIEGLARPVSGWLRRCAEAEELGADLAEAVAAAGMGQVATLILPHDLQLADGGASAPACPMSEPGAAAPTAVDAAARALAQGGALLFLGGRALSERGLLAAGRIARASGARLMSQTSNARAERGRGLPAFEKLPYLPELALEALTGHSGVVLAGAKAPVAFFGWPGLPSRLLPEGCPVTQLAAPEEDVVGALEALAEALKAPDPGSFEAPPRPEAPAGELTAEALCTAIAALQPEGAILVDEAVTSGWHYHDRSRGAPRFTQLSLTGGAIGFGPACATGAAVACPGRRVINLEADGSGLYSVQALWTQAREGLEVVSVICSNRRYRILELELQRAGVNRPGDQAGRLTGLNDPAIDWVSLARGFGVPAVSVARAEDFAAAFRRALSEPGPALIEAVIA